MSRNSSQCMIRFSNSPIMRRGALLSVCVCNQHLFERSSFASHIQLEPDYDNLKIIRTAGDVKLQKLSIAPQTVPKSRRTTNLARSSCHSSDTITRLGTPLMSRATSIDHAPNSCAFNKLCRRLATINSSASSCHRCTITFTSESCHIDAGPAEPAPSSIPSWQSNQVCCRRQIHWHSAHRINSRSGAPMDKRLYLLSGRRRWGSRSRFRVFSRAFGEVIAYLDGGHHSTDCLIACRVRVSPTSHPYIWYVFPSHPVYLLTHHCTDDQEVGISSLTENIYQDNNHELQHDIGPHVYDGLIRWRNTAPQNFIAQDYSNHHIEATLIAHLSSHTATHSSICTPTGCSTMFLAMSLGRGCHRQYHHAPTCRR